MEQNGGPRNKSMCTGTFDYGKSSTFGRGRIGIWGGKNSSDPYLTPHIKCNGMLYDNGNEPTIQVDCRSPFERLKAEASRK